MSLVYSICLNYFGGRSETAGLTADFGLVRLPSILVYESDPILEEPHDSEPFFSPVSSGC